MKEEYKDIVGYENLYQISTYGNVKSLKYGKERILKPAKTWDGYLQVDLYNQGNKKTHLIHRLVAMAFIENPQNLPQVNHKDEDKTNNRVSNLEFCTAAYNNNYGTHNQRMAESKSKQVLCIETGKIYHSAKEVQRELGFDNSNILKCINGKQKTAYGYTWQYVS